MDRIKRLSTEILSEYKDNFGTDFSENKKMLNEITIVRSKGLKNKIAGYITKILLREHKFQVRKQKLIDDEKKSTERNSSQEKAPTPEPETVDVESTPEPETVDVESTPEPETVDVESTPEPETVDVENPVEKTDSTNQETEQKTLAEEVVDSMAEPEDKS